MKDRIKGKTLTNIKRLRCVCVQNHPSSREERLLDIAYKAVTADELENSNYREVQNYAI